jgi:hypothetical protein
MTPVILELPNDVADWPKWLERQLVGLRLSEFVEELELIAGPQAAPPPLDALLGAQASQVLARGLSALNEAQLRALLKHPRLLLELQERVLIDGGGYWSTVERSEGHQRATAKSWKKLEAALGASAPRPGTSAPAGESAPPARRSRRLAPWLATAAAVAIVGVTIWMLRPDPAPTGWGWDRPGALAVDLPADRYLAHLADGANEWFNSQPGSAEALAQRLREFRRGCDALIGAPHAPLATADRDWLVERCRVWSGKLDAHLADLESQTKPLDQVRTEADETVRKLMQAIRERAAAAAA